MATPSVMAKYIDRRCAHDMCKGKGHYVLMARCQNCAWEGYMWITHGHTGVDRAMQAECPRCLCRTIRAGEWVSA